MLWLLLACTGKDAPEDDTGAPFVPELPTSDCGTLSYDWLSTEGMGEVVDWELMEDLSVDADAAQGLLALAGFGGEVEARFAVRVYRVRFVTQDRGERVESTGLLAYPEVGGAEVQSMAWLHLTTGFDDHCAPSGRGLIWAAPAIVMASLGYAVAAPDYQGQNGFGAPAAEPHPYLLAEPAGINSLDMLRALWAFAASGADPALAARPTRDVGLLGVSEGGAVALWADRFAPHYLPSARILGVSTLMPPLDLDRSWAYAMEHLTVATWGGPAGMSTHAAWYRSDVDVRDVINPAFEARMVEMLTEDCPSAEVPDDITAVTDVFDATIVEQALADGIPEPWACFLEESTLSRSPVPLASDTPTRVALGELDDVALVEVQREVLPTLCAQGMALEVVECAGADHEATGRQGLDEGWAWLVDRMDGDPWDSALACQDWTPIDCDAQ